MIRFVFGLMVSLVFTGCASAPKYFPIAAKGSGNLEIRVSRPASILMQQETSVFIYEELGDCRRRYLGVIPVGGTPVEAQLPVGKTLSVEFGKGSRSIIGNYQSSDYQTTTLLTKANTTYRLEYRERDGSSELLFRSRVGEAKWEDVPASSPSACATFENVR